MQLGQEDPGINGLVKEAGLRRQIAPIRVDTSRNHKDRGRRPLDVCLPRKVISVEYTGHFYVGDDGVDFSVADACDPFVGSASFHNLKTCVPKGKARKPSDGRVVLNEEDAWRVILSSHVGYNFMAKGQVPCVTKRYICFVSQDLRLASHFDLHLPFFVMHSRPVRWRPLPLHFDGCLPMTAWVSSKPFGIHVRSTLNLGSQLLTAATSAVGQKQTSAPMAAIVC